MAGEFTDFRMELIKTGINGLFNNNNNLPVFKRSAVGCCLPFYTLIHSRLIGDDNITVLRQCSAWT
ncbi:hypothetical protein I7I53_09494 [Histoplasma capsulatum var. duboisii H88]|uniref:Uncharacterized protein n=1 Tax=Ajellomyces capsulatus (strain H88) TaxID=544711 RepID=A0A8A1L6V1_AJEC8|nr:hypothetical protein I7I53_09494 [Histoplasma capsulatum var. duboisii H88]